MNSKKGVEMALNTIVIMVLVVLVLVILAYFLTGGFKNFNKSTECTTHGGTCAANQCPANQYLSGWRCAGSDQVCCTTNPVG